MDKKDKKDLKRIDRELKRFKKEMEQKAEGKDFIKLPTVLNDMAKN